MMFRVIRILPRPCCVSSRDPVSSFRFHSDTLAGTLTARHVFSPSLIMTSVEEKKIQIIPIFFLMIKFAFCHNGKLIEKLKLV